MLRALYIWIQNLGLSPELPKHELGRERAANLFMFSFLLIVLIYNPIYVIAGWWELWIINTGCALSAAGSLALFAMGKRTLGKVWAGLSIPFMGFFFSIFLGRESQLHYALLMTGFIFPYWFGRTERHIGDKLLVYNTLLAAFSAYLVRQVDYPTTMEPLVKAFVESSFSLLFFTTVVFLSLRVLKIIERSDQEQKDILQTLEDVVLVVEQPTTILSSRGGGCDSWFTPWSLTENLRGILNDNDLSHFCDWAAEKTNSQEILGLSFRPVTRSGLIARDERGDTYTFELRARRLGKENFVIIIRNQTTFARQQHEQETTRMRTIQSSRMASLGEMAGGIAHEINNPLAVIAASAQSIKRALDKDTLDRGKVDALLTKIKDTVTRITKIITGLRKFSRDGQGDEAESTDLVTVVHDALDICRDRIKTGSVELHFVETDSVSARCVPVQVSQVLVNLIGNSMDALENVETKTIRIEIGRDASELGPGYSTDPTEHGRPYILIEDSGPGVPADLLEKVFQPFFTTKPVGKGTGLGLSISRSLLTSFGATMRYISTQDSLGGACFLLTFEPGSELIGVGEPAA